jgi:hypothetical protein
MAGEIFSAFTLIPTLEQGRNLETSSNRICERKELVALGFELGAEVNVEVPNPASVCSKGLTSDSKLLIFYLSVLGNGENGTTVARGGVAGK